MRENNAFKIGGNVIKPRFVHEWDLSKSQAIDLQNKLASKVIARDHNLNKVNCVAGVDVAYDEKGNQQFAAAVVLDANSFDLIEFSVAQESVKFPYIPGLFSVREMPTIAKALIKLKTAPDLIVCDGKVSLILDGLVWHVI